MAFLYQWADPRESRRIVKIAPGEKAMFWDDCLQHGYICVGWEEVGDLNEFESKDDLVLGCGGGLGGSPQKCARVKLGQLVGNQVRRSPFVIYK